MQRIATKGYVMGGDSGTNIALSNTDKITYSTDTTVAQTSGNLSLARCYLTGVSDFNQALAAAVR